MTSNRFIIVLSAKLCSTHILGAYFAWELSAGWNFFQGILSSIFSGEIVHCHHLNYGSKYLAKF